MPTKSCAPATRSARTTCIERLQSPVPGNCGGLKADSPWGLWVVTAPLRSNPAMSASDGKGGGRVDLRELLSLPDKVGVAVHYKQSLQEVCDYDSSARGK